MPCRANENRVYGASYALGIICLPEQAELLHGGGAQPAPGLTSEVLSGSFGSCPGLTHAAFAAVSDSRNFESPHSFLPLSSFGKVNQP